MEYISLAEAVKKAKAAISKHERAEGRMGWVVGEMAARIDPKELYAFADAIGFAMTTVYQYKKTYELWHDFPLKDTVAFHTLRSLNNHPNRKEIVKNNPGLRPQDAVNMKVADRVLVPAPREVSRVRYSRTPFQCAGEMVRIADIFVRKFGTFLDVVKEDKSVLTNDVRGSFGNVSARLHSLANELEEMCKVIPIREIKQKKKRIARG